MQAAVSEGSPGTMLKALHDLFDGVPPARSLALSAALLTWFLLGGMVAAEVAYKVLSYQRFAVHTLDTGIYANLVQNLLAHGSFQSDVLGRSHLGEHFSPIMLLFVPLFALAPSTVWLLAAQGLAGGAACVLLYAVARRLTAGDAPWIHRLLPPAMAILAFCYTPLTAAIHFEFHPSTLGVPLLAGAVLALHLRRRGLLVLLLVLLLATKENASLAVLGLALYAWLVLGHPRQGLALALLAAGAAAIVMLLVMPAFRDADWGHYSRLDPLVDWDAKAGYLLGLVGGLAFLPLLHWRSLVAALPLVALNLSVGYWAQYSSRFQYDDLLSVFLLVSAAQGARRLLLLAEGRGWARPAVLALPVAVALLAQFVGHSVLDQYGHLLPDRDQRQLLREIEPYKEMPPALGIAVDATLGPHFATHEGFVALFDNKIGKRAFNRLRPGGLVLLTPLRRQQQFDLWLAVIRSDPRFHQILGTRLLSVFERLPEP